VKSPYRRLRGRGRRGGRFFAIAAPLSTAWIGPDHLLAVDMFGASEDYRRFYFKEIQAFAVRRTIRYEVWAGILAALLFVSLWAALATTDAARVSFGILAALFGVLLLVHLLRGPTCRCYVVTRVGREELGAFARLRTAKRALDALRPIVVAAQREVALAARRARAAGASVEASPVPAAGAREAPPEAVPEVP
jgi:hypothetical protein